MTLVGVALEDCPGLAAGNDERGSGVVVFQLWRVAKNDLLATTEVLREVEGQPFLLPIISGTYISQTGGSIVESIGKT